MAVAATHAGTYERAPGRVALATGALRAVSRHVPIALALGLVIGIHIPTLHFYFFGDDFLVIGDINSRSFPAYMRDVLLLRDLTPNWRRLTMRVYWGEFKACAFNALPWPIVNLSVHTASALMLYVLPLSVTKRGSVASIA